MKISELKRDVAAIEAGQWVANIPGLDDIELKVRGRDNADWRRLESALIAAVPRGRRVNGRIVPDEVDRITGLLIRDAALLDWRNVADGAGTPIPFSRDAATPFLTEPQFRAFRDGALWAATAVAEGTAAAVEDVIKN